MNPKVSVLIPHYKTPELLKLCLDLLQKYTPSDLARYIVIDNNSQDESIAYLKSLEGKITLIQRETIPEETPAQSHARALDLGLAIVQTPYVLSIHTDTLVKHPQWLNYLITHLEINKNIAGVGSWKLENKPLYKKILKYLERKIQMIYYTIIHKTNHPIEGKGKNYYYLRSHCAIYRTDLLKKNHLTFNENDEVAGKGMHKKLVDQGYDMIFLESSELSRYLDHINHATMILNSEFALTHRARKQGAERIKKYPLSL